MAVDEQADGRIGRDLRVLNSAFVFLFGIVVLLGFVAIRNEYSSERQIFLSNIRDHAIDRATALESTLSKAVYQVDSLRMTVEGMLSGPSEVPASPLFPLLKEGPGGLTFTLDDLPESVSRDVAGNVYGLGSLADLDDAARRKVTIGLWSFIQQQVAMKATPNLAWIYLDFADHRYFMSPWIDTADLVAEVGAPDLPTLIRAVPELDFFRMARPENNPQRRSYWTPVYQDAAGKGLMVTYGAPVYEGDAFQGVVAADLTLSFLRGVLGELATATTVAAIVSRNPNADRPTTIVATSDAPIAAALSDLPAPPSAGRTEPLRSASRRFVDHGERLILEIPFAVAPWFLIVGIDRGAVVRQAVHRLLPWILGTGLALVSMAVLYLDLRGRLRDRYRVTRMLRTLADTDELTGVDNRRSCLNKAADEAGRARRYGTPLAVLMLDIDHFKRVNDTWGHPTGDAAIRAFATACRDTVRDVDIVGRLGGEEFSVVLPATGLDEAQAVAERLLQATRSIEVRAENGDPVSFTCSIGISTLEPTDPGIQPVFSRADAALLQAKRAGRDCVRVRAAATPPRPA